MMGFKFTEVCCNCCSVVRTLSVQLGAIRFDRDLRAITTYLSSQTAFGDAREKFLRLQQLSTILNLDNVSALAYRVHVAEERIRRRMWTSFITDPG